MKNNLTLLDLVTAFAAQAGASEGVDALYALCGYARMLKMTQDDLSEAFMALGRDLPPTDEELRQAAVLKLMADAAGLDAALMAAYLPGHGDAFPHTPETVSAYEGLLEEVRAHTENDVQCFSALFKKLISTSQASLRAFKTGNSKEECLRILKHQKQQAEISEKTGLIRLMQQARTLEQKLRRRIIGQDYAIRAFAKGCFHSACMNTDAKGSPSPSGLFLFAGPSGIGKTLLAQEAAKALSRPCKVLNMRIYAGAGSAAELTGVPATASGAAAGVLTGYVRSHPDCVLVVDELERADTAVIRLFLQLLDEGELEDAYYEEAVSFRDTMIIFTTTAGRSLYDAYPDEHLAGMSPAMILGAVSRKTDLQDGEVPFPAAVCTRLLAGTVIMFGHLDGMHLLRIAERSFGICAEQIRQQFGSRLLFDTKLPSVFLFGESGHPDARQVATRSTQFVMQALYEFIRQAYDEEMAEQPETIELRVTLPEDSAEICALFRPVQTQVVLVVCDASLYDAIDALNEEKTDLTIATASTLEEAEEVLASLEVCMLVIDPMTGYDKSLAKGLGIDDLNCEGMRIFRHILGTMQSLPVFMLSYQHPLRRADKDTCMAMGARGTITYKENAFYDKLAALSRSVYLEERIQDLSRREQVLRYNTAQHLSEDHRTAVIEYYDFELQTRPSGDPSVYIPDKAARPSVRFSDIIGQERAKEELTFFLNYLKHPKEYILKGTRPPKGILLYGPPGTGKTMLAMAMAGEAGITFLPTTATHFMNSYFGESEANIRSLFRTARKYAPSVIFIDEIDAIGKMRTGSSTTAHTENMLNALLAEMDGFMSDPQQPVFVIAATNYQIDAAYSDSRPVLDPALVRRFDNRILVDLPNEEERKTFLTLALSQIEGAVVTQEAVTNVASRSTGQSLSVLRNIIDLAIRNAARAEKALDDAFLINAMDEYSFGEERKWGREYYEGIAYHESGHAYISYLSGEKQSFMTIVSRSDFSGYMQREDREDMPSYTKEQMLWLIRTSLAGRASEIVFFGKEAGTNTGVSSDLTGATALALSMLTQYGMYDDSLLSIDTGAIIDTPAGEKILESAEKILEEEMARTIRLIEEGKEKVSRLAAALLEKNQLTGSEIRKILEA